MDVSLLKRCCSEAKLATGKPMYLIFCRLYSFSPQDTTAVFGPYLSSLYSLLKLIAVAVLPNHMMGQVSWDPKRGRTWPLCIQSYLNCVHWIVRCLLNIFLYVFSFCGMCSLCAGYSSNVQVWCPLSILYASCLLCVFPACGMCSLFLVCVPI
jgi:hypothetical protein